MPFIKRRVSLERADLLRWTQAATCHVLTRHVNVCHLTSPDMLYFVTDSGHFVVDANGVKETLLLISSLLASHIWKKSKNQKMFWFVIQLMQTMKKLSDSPILTKLSALFLSKEIAKRIFFPRFPFLSFKTLLPIYSILISALLWFTVMQVAFVKFWAASLMSSDIVFHVRSLSRYCQLIRKCTSFNFIIY